MTGTVSVTASASTSMSRPSSSTPAPATSSSVVSVMVALSGASVVGVSVWALVLELAFLGAVCNWCVVVSWQG
jgi:hypothetical protein